MRAMLDGKNKWIGFDMPLEIGSPLIPEQIKILPAHAFAPMRVSINGIEDIHLLAGVYKLVLRD